VFWVISVYFNIRNILPKSDTNFLGHSVYTQMVSPTIVNNESWHALVEEINIFLGGILHAATHAFRTLHREVKQAWKLNFNCICPDMFHV
jgi:hypothetical protein